MHCVVFILHFTARNNDRERNLMTVLGFTSNIYNDALSYVRMVPNDTLMKYLNDISRLGSIM